MGGRMTLGNGVRILRDSVLETAGDGEILIGANTWIHPRCQLNAYRWPIVIGDNVDIAPSCALYSYDHGTQANRPIREQPLTSKGPIIIEDGVWLGFGVIVLSGVKIGRGTAVGAGSIVTNDLPPYCIAAGVPARKIRERS
jgi:acetyltransferase-like isoleucine patch superfamily enzyme